MRSFLLLVAGCLAVALSEAKDGIRATSDSNRELIVGGSAVTGNEFNFVAQIPNGNRYCGGALINKQHVLTSASCLDSVFSDGEPSYVIIGPLNDLSVVSLFRVDCITTHPDYDNSGTFPIADIALIRLHSGPATEPVPLNDYEQYPTFDSSLTFLASAPFRLIQNSSC